MRLSLRWKIAVSFALLSVASFGLLYLFLNVQVRDSETRQLTTALLSEARLLAGQVPVGAPGSGVLQAWARHIDRALDARLTLIGPTGAVWADSREAPALMANHAGRPERLQALGQGAGSAVRFSETLGMAMLYVAVPVGPGTSEAPTTVLRLARPVVEVYAAQAQLQRALLLACLVPIVLIWPVSASLAGRLTASVSQLVWVARRVAKGDLRARVEGLREPELAELGATLDSAVEALGRLLETSRRESRYYAAILQQMSDAVVVVDRSGQVQFVNATFARVFGVDQEAAAGLSSEQMALSYELTLLLARAVEQGATQHDEVRVLHPELRVLAAIVTPLYGDEGEVIGAVALLHDVSGLRRSEEIRREFVANASHELRTPAAGIKALAEALQMGALRDPDKGPRFIGQIVEAADRLTAILDDMLVLTRVERGWQLMKPEPLLVAPLVSDVVEQLRLVAEGKRLSLQVSVPAEDMVTADANGLRTALLNLVDNAIKYTPEGGRVSVSGHATPAGYQLTVTDTGLGIPPEHQDRIFERFYRVDKARDRATGGTGLGLSIVKHIVEAHGGRVGVRSTPGQGSSFAISLDTVPASAPPSPVEGVERPQP